jgi:hypothetical protein
MTTEKSPKIPKFSCIKCNYDTCNKKDFTKHLSTLKHQKYSTIQPDTTEKSQKIPNYYACKQCYKVYKYRDGLWRHLKKCNSEFEPVLCDIVTNNDTKQLTELVMKMVEQNQELTKQIIELAKNSGNNHHNTNTINNNNNKFNLNVFLNETCKDAINLSDFVNQIHLSINDLEETGSIGYAEGISKVFIKNLTDIDYTKRPIHCSDSKRETLYIKDDNQWSKDDENKSIITKAIKQVANKNIKNISEWQKIHPEYSDPDSKQNDKYMKIVLNSMSGSTIEEQNKNMSKIISNVVKEVVIEK